MLLRVRIVKIKPIEPKKAKKKPSKRNLGHKIKNLSDNCLTTSRSTAELFLFIFKKTLLTLFGL
jgi:hypothetical protein